MSEIKSIVGKGIHIHDYKRPQKIAEGGFGIVFGIETGGKHSVIKVDSRSTHSQLRIENEVYNALQKNGWARTGFPWMRNFIFIKNKPFLILERCGPSLCTLLHRTENGFSRKTVTLIAIQLIHRLKTLHGVGFLHRDIKPNNILVGLHNDKRTLDTIYLIDFGNAKKFKSENRYLIEDGDENGECAGTNLFSPLRWHTHRVQSCRDDLISMVYVLSYLMHKSLPWSEQVVSKKARLARMVQLKTEIDGYNLFPGCPKQFIEMFNYIDRLSFGEVIDYRKLRRMMRTALYTLNDVNEHENLFEWHDWEFERIYSP